MNWLMLFVQVLSRKEDENEVKGQEPLRMFNVDFPIVKWSDKEPWLIEDLKKLEVVEEYD